MIAKFGWLCWRFNANVNPFVFSRAWVTTDATTVPNPWWAHTHSHQDEPNTSLCSFRAGGVWYGSCLQCLKFPNRPLNDFRDAIFKAYIVNLGFSCCLNMKKIFDCIFNGTFWATFCKKNKTSKKSRERLPGWGEQGGAEVRCGQ